MASINAAIQNPAFAVSFFGAFFSLTGTAVYSFANGLESAFPVSLAWVLHGHPGHYFHREHPP